MTTEEARFSAPCISTWLRLGGEHEYADAVETLAGSSVERASMLKLLDAPSPGLRVRGEGPDGPFEWAPDLANPAFPGSCVGWSYNGREEEGLYLYPEAALPMLWALVSSGAATVTGFEDAIPSTSDGISGSAQVILPDLEPGRKMTAMESAARTTELYPNALEAFCDQGKVAGGAQVVEGEV